MADGNAALDQPEEIEQEAKTPASQRATPRAGDTSLSFPLEGDSKWVTVMRLLAFGTLGVVLVIGAVFQFLASGGSFVENQQLTMILSGIVFLLVLEYFIFLKIVIPRQADYGRYAIYEDRVEYYPLTALGLGIRKDSERAPLRKFLGITTGRVTDKKGRVSYAVYLVHGSNKGKSIKVRSFAEPMEAETFAVKLSEKLQLNVASGLVRKPQRRAL